MTICVVFQHLNLISVGGFNRISSAVVALVGCCSTDPPAAHSEVDQFSAFGQTSVLRSMTEEESLSAMAEISAIIFRRKSTFFSMLIYIN